MRKQIALLIMWLTMFDGVCRFTKYLNQFHSSSKHFKFGDVLPRKGQHDLEVDF